MKHIKNTGRDSRNWLIGLALVATILAVVFLLTWQTGTPNRVLTEPSISLDIYERPGDWEGRSHVYSFTTSVNVTSEGTSLPKWDRRELNPPVSAIEAILEARKFVSELEQAKKFPPRSKLTNVYLTPIDYDNDVWIWVVQFEIIQTGNESEFLRIVVDMDGQVLPPKVSVRIDKGWPPPGTPPPPPVAGLSDAQIVGEFIHNLNIDRKHCGQFVTLTGNVEQLPYDHKAWEAGLSRRFVTKDGQELFVQIEVFHANDGVQMEVTGQLLGYRDLTEEGTDWTGLKLLPGIRFKSYALSGK